MIYFSDKNDCTIINTLATTIHGHPIPSHVGDPSVLSSFAHNIEYAQADGDELVHACNILGRKLPIQPSFIFCGDDARTIAANWS